MTSKTQPNAMLYMDFNATTPLATEVVADITESLSQHWANPSSTHSPGLSARRVVEEARGHVASAIGARPEHVIFTSGGTEANNMVTRGALDFYSSTGRHGTPHVITSDIEHDAVEEPIADLQRRRLCSVTRLRCSSGGRVEASDLRAALTADTCLVSLMHANNETGVLNDIEALACVLAGSPYRHHIWFHTDSAQTVGKVEVDASQLGVDFLTVVGHKLYGPRIGALWASPLGLTRLPSVGGACVSLLRGGGQENGLRPGTENTPLVRGLGTACRLVKERLTEDSRRMERLRDLMEARLLETGIADRINLRGSPRLPNTSSVVLAGRCSGRQVLRRCRRLLASVGSACHETVGEAMSESTGGSLGGPGALGDRRGVSEAQGGVREPGDGQEAPGDGHGASGDEQGATRDDQGAPEDEQGATRDDQGAPEDEQGAPGDDQGAPGDEQGAPEVEQGAPEDEQGAPGVGWVPGGVDGARGGLSRVLLRSGVAPEDARRTVRLSLGRATTEEDVLEAVEDLRQALLEAEREGEGKEMGNH